MNSNLVDLTFHVLSNAQPGLAPLAVDMANSFFNGGGRGHPPLTAVNTNIDVVTAPTFSNLNSPTIAYGTNSTMLSGTILAGPFAATGNVAITLGNSSNPDIVQIGADGSLHRELLLRV